jgi:hypothetical protein
MSSHALRTESTIAMAGRAELTFGCATGTKQRIQLQVGRFSPSCEWASARCDVPMHCSASVLVHLISLRVKLACRGRGTMIERLSCSCKRSKASKHRIAPRVHTCVCFTQPVKLQPFLLLSRSLSRSAPLSDILHAHPFKSSYPLRLFAMCVCVTFLARMNSK